MIAIAYIVFPVNTEITKLFPLGLDAAYAGGSGDLKHFFSISASKESTDFIQCRF